MKKAITSLSIAARVTLDMHSLNNEGGEGNQIQTRIVDVVDHQGKMQSVNAVSGDMLKHGLVKHYHRLARAQALTLCQSCQQFNVNRINADKAFFETHGGEKVSDALLLDRILHTCAIDDMAGVLVTEKRALARKSVVEFGWMLGLPDRVSTRSFFHAKYASERGVEKRTEDADRQQKSGSNLGQNIFHRPASSGVYALVCHLELARIGYNDITQKYALADEEERQKRATVLLESLLYAILELNGAMRSTQLPHLVALEGAMTLSQGPAPAPLISPLMGGSDEPALYRQQLQEIVTALNGSEEPQITLETFETLGAFATLMRTQIDTLSPVMMVTGQ